VPAVLPAGASGALDAAVCGRRQATRRRGCRRNDTGREVSLPAR